VDGGLRRSYTAAASVTFHRASDSLAPRHAESWASVAASAGFTAISTVFNWYAMRKGVFVVGEGSASLAADLRRIPRILLEFVILGPVTLRRICARRVLMASRMMGAIAISMPADSSHD